MAGAGVRFGGRLQHSRNVRSDRRIRRYVWRDHRDDSALMHVIDETLPRASGNQNVNTVERVVATLEIMDRFLVSEVEPAGFDGFTTGTRLKEQETSRLSCVPGDRAPVLTDNGKPQRTSPFSFG